MHKIPHCNVMIVEDEALLLSSLERHIDKLDLGFKIICKAQNGKEALDMLESHDVHLVISDIIMPVMTGLELLEHINNHFPQTLTVILSGHADFNYAQNALRVGALDYILKPITQEKIEAVLLKARLKLSSHYQLIEDDALCGHSAKQSIDYARNHLRNHFSEPVDLSALAKSLGISSSYLTKLFNKYEKCTPIKYLTNLRIAKAKNLLYNTDLPIKEIGEITGYDNQFYFSRVFRKIVMLTPSEYRDKSRIKS